MSSRCLKHSVVHKYLHLFLRLVHHFFECFMATLWSTNITVENHHAIHGSYFVQRLFAMDPTLSKHFLRWILLCPNTFCDGSYFVQTLFAMDTTLSNISLRWLLLCPKTFCDGSYFVQTLFAMDPTLSKHFLRWDLPKSISKCFK